MCHRFTPLTAEEVDLVIDRLRTVARLMDEGALGPGADNPAASAHVRRPHDLGDIDAYPGSSCWVITAEPEDVGPGSAASHGAVDLGNEGPGEENAEEVDPRKSGASREKIAASLRRTELTWGIEVSWKTGLVFNTRLESALGGSAMWRGPLEHGRCLVPVAAFFETRNVEPPSDPLPLEGVGATDAMGRAGGSDDTAHASGVGLPGAANAADDTGAASGSSRGRRPQFRFAAPGDGGVLLLAGLREGDRFTVVTTEPNAVVGAIHDRMPLVLSPTEALTWLDGTHEDLAALADRAHVALEAQEQAAASRGRRVNPDQMSLF